MLICSACGNTKQKPENSDGTIVEDDEKSNIPEEAKRNLAQADIEIAKAHREIDLRFDKLLDARITGTGTLIQFEGAGYVSYDTITSIYDRHYKTVTANSAISCSKYLFFSELAGEVELYVLEVLLGHL